MHVEFRRNDNAIRARYATDASLESEGGQHTGTDISGPEVVGRFESQIIVALSVYFADIIFTYAPRRPSTRRVGPTG